NEVLDGYNHVTLGLNYDDISALGNANARFGIPGGQSISGLTSISVGSGLSDLGTLALILQTLDNTYQVDEKLTWSLGRHTLKFGGQLLRLSQQRYYSGNNGALGFVSYTGRFTNFGFADFLLDQVSEKGRGSVTPPWTQLQNRI